MNLGSFYKVSYHAFKALNLNRQRRESTWSWPLSKWTCDLKNTKSFYRPFNRSFPKWERKMGVWSQISTGMPRMKMIFFWLKRGKTGKLWMTTCGRSDSRYWWEPRAFWADRRKLWFTRFPTHRNWSLEPQNIGLGIWGPSISTNRSHARRP